MKKKYIKFIGLFLIFSAVIISLKYYLEGNNKIEEVANEIKLIETSSKKPEQILYNSRSNIVEEDENNNEYVEKYINLNEESIPIPRGFKYIALSETIAIQDENNENLVFIWIPVKYDNIESIKESLKLKYKENGIEDVDNIEATDPINSEDYINLKNSIETYKGFYMSVAEFGYDEDGNYYNKARGMDLKTENTGYAKNGDYYRQVTPENYKEGVTEKSGLECDEQGVYHLSYDKVISIAKNVYSEDKSVSSHLTYGFEWDAAMLWLLDTYSNSNISNLEESILKDSSDIPGNKYFGLDAEELKSIKTEYLLNGLFGMAGNLSDITQETLNGNYILRGGSWNTKSNETPMASRILSETVDATDIGFRTCLYIKTENTNNSEENNVEPPNTTPDLTETYDSVVDLNEGKSSIEGNVHSISDNENIKNVQVELIDKDTGDIKGTASTDENGNYKFENVEGASANYISESNFEVNSKKYELKFTYGGQAQLSENKKYNGQDYESTQSDENIESNTDVTTNIETEIVEEEEEVQVEKKKYNNIEICIVLDQSGSMYEDAKIVQAQAGTINLINKLFATYEEHVSMSFEIFKEQVEHFEPFIQKSKKDYFIKTLKDEYGGEGEVAAFYANNPAMNEMLKQAHAKLTDAKGTNTAVAINTALDNYYYNGNTYYNDATRYILVITDGEPTCSIEDVKLAYQKAMDRGFVPITLIIGEHNYDTSYTSGSATYFADSDQIFEMLEKGLYEIITEGEIKSNIQRVDTVDITAETVIASEQYAQDDIERRNEVNNNFKEIDYVSGTMIRQLDPDITNKSNLGEIARSTQMIAKMDIEFHYAKENIKGANLRIKERPKNNVEINKKISNLSLVLSNGSTLISNINDQSVINLNKNLMITMDDEIIHGATLTVTYDIKVTNKSGSISNQYTIYDYVDPNFIFVKANNEDQGWEVYSNGSDKMLDTIKQNVSTIVKTSTRQLAPGDSETKSITLSKMLDINCNCEFSNYVEIGRIYNSEGRRIYKEIPANLDLSAPIIQHEEDSIDSEFVSIVPPFGGEPKQQKTNILGGKKYEINIMECKWLKSSFKQRIYEFF